MFHLLFDFSVAHSYFFRLSSKMGWLYTIVGRYLG